MILIPQDKAIERSEFGFLAICYCILFALAYVALCFCCVILSFIIHAFDLFVDMI